MIKVLALQMFETGVYNDMVIRPYSSTLDGSAVHAFQETTLGGSRLTPDALAGVAGQIVRPTAQALGRANVVNGWDTRRLRFMLAIEQQDFAGASQIQYLTGYTDEVGVSHSRALNPNMRLYFNSSVLTRRVMMQTAYGPQYMQNVNTATQLLRGGYSPSFNGFETGLNAVEASMRPFDVFTILQSAQADPYGHFSKYDLRSTFAEGIKKNSYKNNSAPTYLSGMFTELEKGYAAADSADDVQSVYSRIIDGQRSEVLYNDPFLSAAARQTSFLEGGSITYGELCALCPGIDDIVDVHVFGDVQRTGTNFREHSEHWHGSNNETVLATILSHSVPAAMVDLMLTKVGFTATNRTLNGALEVKISGAQTFAEGLDLSPYLQAFLVKLEGEVFRDLTLNGIIDFYVDCVFSLVGDSVINISVAGGPVTPFRIPSFCDATFAPVVTNSIDSVAYLAHDIEALSTNTTTRAVGSHFSGVYDPTQGTSAAGPTANINYTI